MGWRGPAAAVGRVPGPAAPRGSKAKLLIPLSKKLLCCAHRGFRDRDSGNQPRANPKEGDGGLRCVYRTRRACSARGSELSNRETPASRWSVDLRGGILGPTKGRPLRTILVEGPSRQRQAVPRVPAPQTRYKTRPRPRRWSTSYDRPAALPTTPSRRQAHAPEAPLPSRRPRSTRVLRGRLTARAVTESPKTEPNERSKTIPPQNPPWPRKLVCYMPLAGSKEPRLETHASCGITLPHSA